MSKFIAVLSLALCLVGSPSLGWGASGSSKFTNGGTVALNEDLQTIPDSATDLATKDTWVFQLTIVNTTASGVTLVIADKATVPKTLMTVTIAANTTYVIAFPEGQKMKGGLTWQAGTASALNGSIKAKRLQ